MGFGASAQKIQVNGKVYSKDQYKPISGVEVFLYEANSEISKKKLNKAGEKFFFTLELDKQYQIKATKEGFLDEVIDISTFEEDLPATLNITLTIGKNPNMYAINGVLLDRDTKETLPNTRVEITNTMTFERFVTYSDNQGKYLFNVRPGYDYAILAANRNYLKRRMQLNYCGGVNRPNHIFCVVGFSAFGNGNKDNAFDSEILMDKIVLGKTFKIDNIYYDYNQAYIRNDAAKELNKLVAILKDNPQIQVELGSHCDSRGTDQYNLLLSQRRAQAAVSYILTKGISIETITAKGYGETQLVNECGNGVICDDYKHQENRRTEFKIIGIRDFDDADF